MIKLTKTAIGAISVGSAVIIAGSTILVNLALKNEDGTTKPINPLNRPKNYHSYSLVSKMQTNPKLKNLIDYVKQDKQLVYYINETKFLNGFKTIVQETLKSIPAFSLNYLNYVIEVSYKLKNTRSILIDLVWYEPQSKIKYFDQFELFLQTT